MRNTAITQIALIGISLVIIFTYIRPTFANIRIVQDEIFQYADATAKANEFNSLLQQLLARERSFSNADIAALEEFLPSEIDSLAVMDDIDQIVSQNGGEVVDLAAGELSEPNRDVEFDDYFDEQSVTANRFVNQEFELVMVGDYFAMTSVLRQLESLAYIMEISDLSFGSVGTASEQLNPLLDPDQIEVTMVLKTYALSVTQ